MAFNFRQIGTSLYTNGWTQWYYRTTADTFEAVTGPDYFNSGSDILTVGDFVSINASDASGIRVVLKAEVDSVVLGPLA